MTARRRRTMGALESTIETFIRDLPKPAPGTTDFNAFLWIRLSLEGKDLKLFGANSKLPGFWRTGGPAIVAELGLARAQELRCWQLFGDPR